MVPNATTVSLSKSPFIQRITELKITRWLFTISHWQQFLRYSKNGQSLSAIDKSSVNNSSLHDVKAIYGIGCVSLTRPLEYKRGQPGMLWAIRCSFGWTVNGPLPKRLCRRWQYVMFRLIRPQISTWANKSRLGGTKKVMVQEWKWTCNPDQMWKHGQLWKRQLAVKIADTLWKYIKIFLLPVSWMFIVVW